MTYPIPNVGIGTPYGKRGQSWSCDKNSQGGIHTGVDFPCGNGTRIYAPVAGEIRHRSYGSAFGSHQFAISPDADQPFGDGEVFFAHTRTRLSNGTRVEVGDFIAEVGSEGNVTGPHLHMEYMPSTKGSWRCGIHANPQPVLDHVPPGEVYLSKLVYGQKESDSVSRLQAALNAHPLSGGATLPVTGNYGDQTDAEVRKCQSQHGFGNDPVGGSSVGSAQAEHLFAGTGNTIVNDLAPDPEEPEKPEPGWIDHAFGLWKWYSGKETSEINLDNDGDWHKILKAQPASGITANSSEHHFLYLRVGMPADRTADRTIESKFVRSNGDATAYSSPAWSAKAKDSVAIFNVHFEDGDGQGGQWWVKVTGGDIKITTRYAKTHLFYVDEIEMAAMLLTGLGKRIGGLAGDLLVRAGRKVKDGRALPKRPIRLVPPKP